MGRQYILIRKSDGRTLSVLLLFVAAALALSACGPETLVVGLEPTPTPTPLPTPVVRSYVNNEYGFTFRYPETWTLEEEPHLVKLSQGTLMLNIAYGWASNPGFSPMGGRTGMPAGDFIYGDKVFFLDRAIPAQVLEYERRDKMVLYGGTGLMDVGDLVFSMWLEDTGGTPYEELNIPKALQAEAKAILESFERSTAEGQPVVATPTPAPDVDKDLNTYVNEAYELAFVYPTTWELEEGPPEPEASGTESPAGVRLTKGSLRLAIEFKFDTETTVLGPRGRPAGEIEERGPVMVLGREVPKQVVVYEGKVKSVFLRDRFDALELYVQLDGAVGDETEYEAIDIPESAASAMGAILGSLTRTGEHMGTGRNTLTYENAAHRFSFQYPASWRVEEVTGEIVEEGVRLADSVILTRDEFAIVVQFQRKSDPAQIAWGGDDVPGGMGYAEATLGERVTLLGEETYRYVWMVDGGLKAVEVNTHGKSADLILSITLADGSVRLIQDDEAASIPDSAIAALDQVINSFAVSE